MRLALLACLARRHRRRRVGPDARRPRRPPTAGTPRRAKSMPAPSPSRPCRAATQSPQLAAYLQEQFRAGGLTDVTIHPHDETAALILRWPAARPSGRKAILLMAHMDVVEARREDWSRDPFTLDRGGRLFLRARHAGRQAGRDRDHHRLAAAARRGLPARPRHHRPVHRRRGDRPATAPSSPPASGSTPSTIDFALNGDAGGGAFLADGTLLGFGIQTAEKTYQSYTLTATNPGGHSSRPAPRQCDLRARPHARAARAPPLRADAERDHPRLFRPPRHAPPKPPLAAAIRRWLANPNDGEAADLIEASPTEVGLTRTRCVATRLEGGHADNALPQLARATVNCRIFPGVDPATVLATLRALGAPDNVAVEPVDIARPTDASPLREDVVAAYTAAVRARHPGAAIVPDMSTGATDGLYFRARGVPVYGVDGSWAVIPADERAHGRDERLPVRAFYNDVDHWTDLIRRLAGWRLTVPALGALPGASSRASHPAARE